jgi:hypothetical protein
MWWLLLVFPVLGIVSYILSVRSERKADEDAQILKQMLYTFPIPTDPPPGDPANTPVFQVSIENKARSPKWYAPQRDLVNVYSQILRSSLARLEKKEMPAAELERIGKVAQAMGILQRKIVSRDFAGNQDALMKELKAIQELDPYAFSLVGASLLATMTYWFWKEYSAVSG